MRQFVRSLSVFISVFAVANAAAAAKSENKIQNKYCEAVLYGSDYEIQPTLFGNEFRAFSQGHPEWRAAVSWGTTPQVRMHVNLSEPVTHRFLPVVPIPKNAEGTNFAVATTGAGEEDGSPIEHGLGLYRVVPMQNEQTSKIKYAVKVPVTSRAARMEEVDLITLYVALASVPYADHMILEQSLATDSFDVNEAGAMQTVLATKNAGKGDGEALNLIVPTLVKVLVSKGEPFKFVGRRHFATKKKGRGDIPSNLQEADHVFIQYHFRFKSMIDSERSLNNALN